MNEMGIYDCIFFEIKKIQIFVIFKFIFYYIFMGGEYLVDGDVQILGGVVVNVFQILENFGIFVLFRIIMY